MNDTPTDEKMWGYIGGMLDGEGSVTHPKHRPSGAIVIANTDLGLLKPIQVFLQSKNIKSTIIFQCPNPKKWGTMKIYLLQIYGWQSLYAIFKNCPILSNKKYTRLQKVIYRGIERFRQKQTRINKIIRTKKQHPYLPDQAICNLCNEHQGNMMYRWGVKKTFQSIEESTR